MTIGSNFVAGLVGSFWPAIISLAVVPTYLKFLGIEAYGLIGFFIAMQAVMQLLDLGLSATISREVARFKAAGDIPACRDILKTFAAIYWAMAIVIGLLVGAAAPLIANYWLNSKTIPTDVVAQALLLMGCAIAARWPSGLYLGVLTGAERLVLANGVTVAMSTVASVGAVVVLAFVSPTIEAFFLWQAVAGLAIALTMRRAAWHAIGGSRGARIQLSEMKRVWRFSVAVSGVTLSGTLFTQLDKIILSKTISLSDFGKYMLATTVAGLIYRFVSPMFNIIYPRFSALISKGSLDELYDIYKAGTNTFAALLFPVAMVMVICASAAVVIWTGNHLLAQEIGPLIAILTVGNALHGIMYFPFALQLAYGNARLPLQINLALSIAILPLIAVLSVEYGAIGGALSWLTLHVLYLIFGSWLTHRKLLPELGARWLTHDVGMPLLVSGATGVVAWTALSGWQASPVAVLAFGIVVLGLTIAASYRASSRRLSDIRQLLGASTHSSIVAKVI